MAAEQTRRVRRGQLRSRRRWRQYTWLGGNESSTSRSPPAGSRVEGEVTLPPELGRLGELLFWPGPARSPRPDWFRAFCTGASDISIERAVGRAEITTGSARSRSAASTDRRSLTPTAHVDRRRHRPLANAANGRSSSTGRSRRFAKSANGDILLGAVTRRGRGRDHHRQARHRRRRKRRSGSSCTRASAPSAANSTPPTVRRRAKTPSNPRPHRLRRHHGSPRRRQSTRERGQARSQPPRSAVRVTGLRKSFGTGSSSTASISRSRSHGLRAARPERGGRPRSCRSSATPARGRRADRVAGWTSASATR
jgi:hypothetical protein